MHHSPLASRFPLDYSSQNILTRIRSRIVKPRDKTECNFSKSYFVLAVIYIYIYMHKNCTYKLYVPFHRRESINTDCEDEMVNDEGRKEVRD